MPKDSVFWKYYVKKKSARKIYPLFRVFTNEFVNNQKKRELFMYLTLRFGQKEAQLPSILTWIHYFEHLQKLAFVVLSLPLRIWRNTLRIWNVIMCDICTLPSPTHNFEKALNPSSLICAQVCSKRLDSVSDVWCGLAAKTGQNQNFFSPLNAPDK